MNLREYQALQAEVGALEKLLEEIPVDHVIDRMGLESRKQELEELLAAHNRDDAASTLYALDVIGEGRDEFKK